MMLETLAQSGNSILNSFATNPIGFSILLAIGLTVIWFKWWIIGRAQRNAAKSQYAGWTEDAKRRSETHETGVGSKDVLVMKPVKFGRIGLMTLAFFGGGAWFYMAVVLKKPDVSTKDWAVFAIFVGFSLIAVFLLVQAFTRIQFDGEQITKRSLYAKTFHAKLADLTSVKPAHKTIAGGVDLHFNDGRKLRVKSQMSGYRQLLEQLSSIDPKLKLMTQMVTKVMQKQV
ncbi:MAG: hypothetical protein ABJ246_19945 [Paracoccaceae bacterium]